MSDAIVIPLLNGYRLSLAPVPDVDWQEPDWQDFALCAQTDPEAFFPEKGGSTREAKKVCRGCEVRAECLEYALEHDERFGIWGGLSERERRRLKRSAGDEPVRIPAGRCQKDLHDRTEANSTTRADGGIRCKLCEQNARRLRDEKEAA